jgi:ATP-dependent DNA ligase
VIDGEIIIATEAGLDFDTVQQPTHPAASRVRMLSEQTPAAFIAFDLLTLDEDFTGRPFAERRAALVAALAGSAGRCTSHPHHRPRPGAAIVHRV